MPLHVLIVLLFFVTFPMIFQRWLSQLPQHLVVHLITLSLTIVWTSIIMLIVLFFSYIWSIILWYVAPFSSVPLSSCQHVTSPMSWRPTCQDILCVWKLTGNGRVWLDPRWYQDSGPWVIPWTLHGEPSVGTSESDISFNLDYFGHSWHIVITIREVPFILDMLTRRQLRDIGCRVVTRCDDMRFQRKSYVYTCFTTQYKYSTVVYATSVKQARIYGLREAKQVMGRCAVIRRDVVEEQKWTYPIY